MSAEAPTLPLLGRSKSPSLLADFGWMFVGNAVYAAGQFLTLILLAKLVRPEMVGQYALGLAIVYPVMMFTNLQLKAVITSDTQRKIEFGHYLGLRLLTTPLALAVIFAITQALRYDRDLTKVVLMVGVAYGIETISDVYYARLQLNDRMAAIAKSLMVRALLAVVILVLAVYFSRSVLWGIAGVALGRAIVLFGYDIAARTQGSIANSRTLSRTDSLAPRFNAAVQRKLLWVSFPLGIVVLLGCLNSSIPNFFIKHALGERDVGIFAAIGFVISVGNMAVVSLGQSAFTRLASAYASGDIAGFGWLLGKLLAFGAAISTCGMILSKFAGAEILTILFRPEYAERADLLPWVMGVGGVLFMAQFLGFGMTAANFYHSQVVLNAIASLSLFILCFWLVPGEGLLGAILAMLIAAIVQLAGSILVLAHGVRMQTRLCANGTEGA